MTMTADPTLDSLLADFLVFNTDSLEISREENERIPGAVYFFTLGDCRPGFEGLTADSLFETNALLGEMDDSRKYRIERKGPYLLYTYAEGDAGNVSHISGHALMCLPASPEEQAFMRAAMSDILKETMGPLLGALTSLKNSSLPEKVKELAAGDDLAQLLASIDG